MKNTVIFAILFSLMFSGCKTQSQKIEGKVKDIFSNNIEGVSVTVEKSKFSSVTDNSGNYSVDYAPGQIRIILSKEGYTTHHLDLNIQQKSYFPAEDIILYPIPKEKGVFYIDREKKELLNIRQIGVVEEQRKNSKENFLAKLFLFYVKNNNKYPASVKHGDAEFIDTSSKRLNLSSVAKDGLIYAGDLNMFERHDKYSGFLKEVRKVVGEEKLLIRTFELQNGEYSWVEMTGNEAIGAIPKKNGATFYFKASGGNNTDEDFCVSAEEDAMTIASTIADYFAIPSRTDLGSTPIIIGPTAGPPKSGGMNDMEFPALRGRNTAKVTGTVKEIVISVTDGSGRCPIEYQKANAGWNGVQGAGVYTKEME